MVMFVLGCIFGIVFSLLCLTVEIMSNSTKPGRHRNKENNEEE